MILDLTPDMRTALSTIGERSACSTDLGVGAFTLKRLWELGFLKLDIPAESQWPAYYSLSQKGEGAAAILTAQLPVPSEWETPITRIKRLTAASFGIPFEEMVSARRSRCVARPRQVAMYLAKKLTPKSLPDIGRQFGNRDHTTVIHAIRLVERMMEEDQQFKDKVKTLMSAMVSERAAIAGDNEQKTPFLQLSEAA
jgi:hypothetical protein